MNEKLRLPWLVLSGQGLILLVLCLTLDSLVIFPVDLDEYWLTAQEMAKDDLKGILANFRTVGYPLLLKLVAFFSPELEALPLVHLILRVLAVCVFCSGLRRLGVRPWLAVIAASPLFYSNILLSRDGIVRVTQVLTDATGESLLILTVGLLLRLLGRPASLLAWLGFMAGLFLTYQTRPAAQAMIVVLPILGFVVLGITASRREWRRLRLRVGLGLVAASWLPFLAWCTVRWFLVGHFGLVCFTGYQLCALAGNFLTDDMLPELPKEVQPYVRAVLERRDQIARGEVTPEFGSWRPSLDAQGHLLPEVIEDDILYTLVAQDLFFVPALEYLGADPASQRLRRWELSVKRDKLQVAAALAIIKARPDRHRQWIVATVRTLPQKLLWSNLVLFSLGVVLALAMALWHATWVGRRLVSGPEAVQPLRGADQGGPMSGGVGHAWELHLLLVLGLGLAVSQGLLLAVVATTSWGSRYTDAPGVLLTPAAAVAIFLVLRRIGELLGLVRAPQGQVGEWPRA